ncbi:MAG: ArsR family transcriptional regulator [Candidatus Neomarinimicrobiota bacterium]|nr:ArsR family transcriptional regulator [Candidatus Neomarinimicrobiota bacterium]
MNPGTRAYLRGLATEFGESTNAIRVELNRLTDAKLLKSVHAGRTVQYRANKQHSLFKDLQSVVKKFVGLDKVAEELAAKLGDVQAAYVIGDYAKGNDSGLIDLLLIGQVDDEKLKEVTEKTEGLIDRKIRTLVLKQSDLERLDERLDLKHALLIWGNESVMGEQ